MIIINSLILTNSQEKVSDEAVSWFRNFNSHKILEPYYSYTGRPGTGKTTISRVICDRLNLTNDEVIGCAYIGKAVSRLQQSGMNAVTLHSLIYQPLISVYIDPLTGNKKMSIEFIKRENLPKHIKLIICDEATMVTDEMVMDLLSFQVPVIFVGDVNQLPPVFGISSVMNNPRGILNEIMRQHEDDPIVWLCEEILAGKPLRPGIYGNSRVAEEFDLTENNFSSFDQILTCTNRDRANINNHVRNTILGYSSNDPRIYDKVICRQNNWDIECRSFSLTTGTTGFIMDVGKKTNKYVTIDFKPDFFPDVGQYFTDLKVDLEHLVAPFTEQTTRGLSSYEKFEYAYAISVHLSQGSEYDNVLYFDRPFGDYEFRKRLRYTAISRAKKSVLITSNINF